jgi:hypothetical protein
LKNEATALRSRRRKMSANPSVAVIVALALFDSLPICASVHSASAVPGVLPEASRRASRQSIALLRP